MASDQALPTSDGASSVSNVSSTNDPITDVAIPSATNGASYAGNDAAAVSSAGPSTGHDCGPHGHTQVDAQARLQWKLDRLERAARREHALLIEEFERLQAREQELMNTPSNSSDRIGPVWTTKRGLPTGPQFQRFRETKDPTDLLDNDDDNGGKGKTPLRTLEEQLVRNRELYDTVAHALDHIHYEIDLELDRGGGGGGDDDDDDDDNNNNNDDGNNDDEEQPLPPEERESKLKMKRTLARLHFKSLMAEQWHLEADGDVIKPSPRGSSICE